MVIVIPLAGASSRFINAGMPPKYTLSVAPFTTLFDETVNSFKPWFDTAKFIFIVKDAYARDFAKHHAEFLKIKDYHVVNLNRLTQGQAESVYEGLKHADIEDDGGPLMIFNIDTIRRNLVIPDDEEWDTLFDAFYEEDSGEAWSFARVDKNNNVLKTAEKKKISNWCSTGLYIFRSVWLYRNAYENAIHNANYNYYIAPLYNYLKGLKNRLLICNKEDIDFSGTPEEYHALYKKYNERDQQ